MRTHMLALFLAGSAPLAVWAEAAAHCPSSEDIRITGGVYGSRLPDGGSWLGIAPFGAGGAIVRFDGALFFPDDNPPYQNGHMGKCQYTLERGNVDLRFKPDAQPEPVARIDNSTNWTLTQGPYGIRMRECLAKAPQDCAFIYRP
jgi:hypothetical protein